MRTLSSSANCVRMPPAALLVEPEASASRSSSTPSRTPSRRRWNAALAPSAPPPITTAFAVRGGEAELPSARVGPLAGVVVELAERLPGAGRATAPLREDLLLDREVVRRRRLQLDAGIEERVLRLLRVEALQRLHQRGPGRVLARVLERVRHHPRRGQPVVVELVVRIEARRVLPEDLLAQGDAR